MNNHSAMIKNERKKLAKERENMWPRGLQPETKGSPRRGKQHIEKKKKKNGKYDREERSPKHKMNVEEKSILVV